MTSPDHKPTCIGFEGHRHGSPTTFGCAAIYDQSKKLVRNACSGAECTLEKWAEYVGNGYSASGCLESPILPTICLATPCMVLTAPDGPVSSSILAHIGPESLVLCHWIDESFKVHYWLFPDLDHLKEVTVKAAPDLIAYANTLMDEGAKEALLEQAYVLDHELSPAVQWIRSLKKQTT